MPRVSHRLESMSFTKQNASVGLGTHHQALRRAHVSSLVMEVSVVSDQPGVLHLVWGRWAMLCLEKELVGQVGNITSRDSSPFPHGEAQCQPVCSQYGLSPCLSALK